MVGDCKCADHSYVSEVFHLGKGKWNVSSQIRAFSFSDGGKQKVVGI